MVTIVFLENAQQTIWAHNSLKSINTIYVALSAAALEMAERLGIDCKPVSKYANTRELAGVEGEFNVKSYSLLKELENYISIKMGKNISEDEIGFLSGQSYHVQYAVSAIVGRAFLIKGVMAALKPQHIFAFQNDIDPLFQACNYEKNPWWNIIEKECNDKNIILGNLKSFKNAGRNQNEVIKINLITYVKNIALKYLKVIFKPITHDLIISNLKFIINKKMPLKNSQALKGFRLLIIGHLAYDWLPILACLRKMKGVECYFIGLNKYDSHDSSYYLSDQIGDVFKIKYVNLNEKFSNERGQKENKLLEIFKEWKTVNLNIHGLEILGINILPSLLNYLESMVSLSSLIKDHTEKVVTKTIDLIKPDMVGLFSIHTLATKYLAYLCRQQDIPVVCYQHGGVYGTHNLVKNQQMEWMHADYFLTYGEGIKPPDNKLFPLRAEFVPVGSTKLETIYYNRNKKEKRRKNKNFHILWLGECTTGNTTGSSFQVEDTERYIWEKKCLQRLGKEKDIKVTFRPYLSQVPQDATSQWLALACIKNIKLDDSKSLIKSIRRADLIITDTSSDTVWKETLVSEKPLIVYCDPRQTLLRAHFKEDLKNACLWCQTWEELNATIKDICENRRSVMEVLSQKEPAVFIEKYILDKKDGNCSSRVIDFIQEKYLIN